MYRVNFHFFDGHQLDIEVEDDLLDKLLEDLGQNRTFFTKEKSSGFWLQGEKIRYFMLNKLGEPQCLQNQNLEVENASKI